MQGIDMLGLASPHWNIKETLKFLPQGCAVGCFWGDDIFGTPITNLKTLLATGKVPAVRIQAWWSDSHKIADMAVLQKRLPKIEALAKQNPNVKFYVSHSCEYNEKNKAAIKKRVDLVVKLCPSCEVVQTPMGGSPVVPGFMVESHGKNAKAPAGIVSGDGQENQQLDMEAWNKRNAQAVIRFSWGMRCNGLEAENHPPRPQRTAYPDAKYLTSLWRILQPKGAPPSPTFNGKVIPISKPLLWKSHAEDMPGPQSRDNRPLIMLPQKTGSVDVVTFQGVSLGKMVYFAPYPPNLSRYYSGLPGAIGLYGYEIADKALKLSGSAFVWIKQGNNYYGPVHPSFRQGYFQ